MKIPQTDWEQKGWIWLGVIMFSVLIAITLNIPRELIQYPMLIGSISLPIFCFIAKRKNWINKEKKL